MQGTVLERIVQDKAVWVADRKASQPLLQFQADVAPSTRDFYQALSQSHPAFILECKRASPSKGLIREDFNPEAIADIYANYASAVSVLTDEPYFQGNFGFLPLVSARTTQPILCKDFIIDPYQIWLARYYQADAILLMLSVLDDSQYQALSQLAEQLSMGVLTEVSNQAELNRALALKAKVIGINNRDLHDLSVNLDKTRQLAPQIPSDTLIISESGIYSHQQLHELSPYVNGFLIGSSLMSAVDLNVAVRRLVFGEHKICGLMRPEDVRNAYQYGALYGGLIFVDGSPRQVTPQQARELVAVAPLQFVGVFRQHAISEIIEVVQQLGLAAVQLHGEEDQTYITALRQALPTDCEIWKAVTVKSQLPNRQWSDVDRYLFDNGAGGSGYTFDWSLLRHQDLSNVMIAGGINTDNCRDALAYGSRGLDVNSGIEYAPGYKDSQHMQTLFARLSPSTRNENS